jgi:predicted AlkP superfamily phosphohydrolase/phosphomutase
MVPAKTVFIGLDGCDLYVAQEFARQGYMPTLARLLESAAVQPTLAPLGYFVSGIWPTLYTGTTPSRHQFLCGGQFRGGTYEPRWLDAISDPPPVWKHLSDAGRRVAVLDAPHAAVDRVNGVMLIEWGAHDRRAGTESHPRAFAAEVDARHGPYPLAKFTAPQPHFAPVDYAHRAGRHRTIEENQALLADLLEGVQRKHALTKDVLARGDWDLFFSVFSESHCTGHELWKFHDPTHPQFDAAGAEVLGGDPLRAVYSALDRSVGELLDIAGPDATFFLHLSHGMRSHFDGTDLIEPVLWRLDEYASGVDTGGRFTRSVDRALDLVPGRARARALVGIMDARHRLRTRSGPIADTRPTDIPRWLGQRRWWRQPNDSVYASVRLNLEGREPNGRIRARAQYDVAKWLAARLLELVNVETGEPAIDNIYLTDDHYERVDGDPFGDLIIEWNRRAPIDVVWSPATGVVSSPYTGFRTGDHHRKGLLIVAGSGIRAGRRAQPMPVVDIGPTLAASLGVDVPSFDGVAHADLLRDSAASERSVAPALGDIVPVQPNGSRRWSPSKFDVPARAWIEDYAVGLSQSLHVDHVDLHALRDETLILRERVGALDQLAQVAQVSTWLRTIDVPESLLISIVMPTRNRADRLMRAIESIQRQSYPHWELLVVDDGSADATPEFVAKLANADARIRPFRLEGKNLASGARNHALDHAKGDIITYLDDDNRFDADWLRSLVWAFNEYPETVVCYGARAIDDDLRHRGLDARSLPFIQFNPWGRDAMLRSNQVDMNVIAHRPTPLRFDPSTNHFADWDLLLQLTDDVDPLPLPVVATYYYSDVADRLSADFRDAEFVEDAMEYIRQRTITRRQSDA